MSFLKKYLPRGRNPVILWSALDWGWGHLTRSWVLVTSLIRETNAQVIFAGSDWQIQWLKRRGFRGKVYKVQSAPVDYDQGVIWGIIRYLVQRHRQHIWERELCEMLVKKERVDIVLSDSKPWFYSRRACSFIISHQIWWGWHPYLRHVQWLLDTVYSNFDLVIVPDYAQYPGLAGLLSHPPETRHRLTYIGPLSRLKEVKPRAPAGLNADYVGLAILSGPPAFRNSLYEKLHGIIRRLTHTKKWVFAGIRDIPDEELKYLIRGAKFIISVAGYSTLMELYEEGFCLKNLILIPTPNQPEQEYIAHLWEKLFGCNVVCG